MSDAIDLARHQREEARWRILRVLDVGRPYPVVEQLIWRTLVDIKLPITPDGVRRELDYLESKQLITLSGREGGTWLAELTGYGVDVVEYEVPTPAGIARPPRL